MMLSCFATGLAAKRGWHPAMNEPGRKRTFVRTTMGSFSMTNGGSRRTEQVIGSRRKRNGNTPAVLGRQLTLPVVLMSSCSANTHCTQPETPKARHAAEANYRTLGGYLTCMATFVNGVTIDETV